MTLVLASSIGPSTPFVTVTIEMPASNKIEWSHDALSPLATHQHTSREASFHQEGEGRFT